MISFRPQKHRLRRATKYLGEAVFLSLFVLLMLFSCAQGVARQEEINRQALPDQCRAEPESCDVPQHTRR